MHYNIILPSLFETSMPVRKSARDETDVTGKRLAKQASLRNPYKQQITHVKKIINTLY
jgi:hypothetical protein